MRNGLVLRWLSIPIWLAVWFTLSLAGVLSVRILPNPVTVLTTLISDVESGALIYHAIRSAGRALAGFALAVPAGILLGALIVRLRLAQLLLEPVFFVSYPVPKIALFPILTFAFGVGTPSKIAFAFLEALYPILVASIFAVRGIKLKLIWTAESMGASRWKILSSVIIPAALPGIFTGLRIALPIALTVTIVTEMIGDTSGLGYFIADAGASFRTDRVYAGIVAVGVLGYVFDRGLALVRRTITHVG